MTKGRFIVIEGCEGAGKSTALSHIKNYLESRNIKTIITREPGGTTIGELLRSIVKGEATNEILDAKAELLLFYAARVQLVKNVIQPALQEGVFVLSDRFELSSFAYQGSGRKQDMEFIRTLSKFCLEGFTSDLTIFLDIIPEEGFKRVHKRGKLDRIEQESLDFFNTVYKSYHEELKKFPKEKYAIVNALSPLTEVQQNIEKVLEKFLAEYATNPVN